MVAPIQIGTGIELGTGIKINPPVVTTTGAQNVTGSPSAGGLFYAVLNRGYTEWDYFAVNGNNGTWFATGNFGSGTATYPVVSETHDADRVFPVVSGAEFQPGVSYQFAGC